MPTPQDLELLEDKNKRKYESLLQIGMQPEDAFNSIYQNQTKLQEAKSKEQFNLEQTNLIVNKDFTGLDPLVQQALGIIQPDYTKPIAERFMPGFFPEVVPSDDPRALPNTSSTYQQRDGTSKDNLAKLKADAVTQLQKYYESQGYPSLEKSKEANVAKLVKELGDQETYVENQAQLGVPSEDANYKYQQLLELVQTPPQGMRGASEVQARQTLYGPYEDPEGFGSIKGPIQPRRYSQYGDMEKVGPRMDSFMQGASPLAEEIKKDPSIVESMPIGELFDEATRPQVVRTGEEERLRVQKQKIAQMDLEGSLRLLKREQGLTYAQGYAKIASELEEQARKGFNKNRAAFKPDNRASSRTGVARYTPAEMEEQIDKRIDTASRAAVIAHFRKMGKYDDFVNSVPAYQGFDDAKIPDYVSQVLKSFTEDEQGNAVIQSLKEQGRIDSDAIVEGTTMQYLRNLNMVFRAVINPAMDIMFDEAGSDILGVLPNQRDGVDEVEFYNKYGGIASPTKDFTEDADGIANTFDAYLREVLVETATGRTLGDDIVSYHPELFYSAAQEELGEEGQQSSYLYSPSSYVMAGTLFEMAIPVELPIRMAATAIKAGTKIPANMVAYGKVAREMNRTPGLETIRGSQVPGLFDAIAQNAKVSSHISDDAADTVLALERLRDAKQATLTDAQVDILQSGLGPKGKQTVRVINDAPGDTADAATKIIDDLAGVTGDNRPIMQAAAKNSQSNIAYGTAEGVNTQGKASTKVSKKMTGTEEIDPVFTFQRHKELKAASMEVAEGQFGLGDYVMLTPRMSISEKLRSSGKVDEAFASIDSRIGPMQPGFEDRLIDPEFFIRSQTDAQGIVQRVPAKILETADGAPVNYNRLLTQRKSSDPKLDAILKQIEDGQKITFESDSYLRQVLLEEEMFMLTRNMDDVLRNPSAMKAGGLDVEEVLPITPGSTFADATAVPVSRRSEIGRAMLRATPKVIKDSLNKATKPLKDIMFGVSKTPLQEAAIETVVSLQRQAPLAMGRLARKGNQVSASPIDDAFAYAFNGQDFTEVNRIPIAEASRIKDNIIEAITKMDAQLSAMTPEELLTDERVITYYRKLLGAQFDSPAGQSAFRDVILTDAVGRGQDIFSPVFSEQILGKMLAKNPEMLSTAAVSFPRAKPSPAQIDYVGAKIAWATDQAAASRLMKLGASIDDYVEAPIKLPGRITGELGFTEQQAQQLLNVQTARVLANVTTSNTADLSSQYKAITGVEYDAAANGMGIKAFMNKEFGVAGQHKALYIRGAQDELRIAKGYGVKEAEAIIMNQTIPALTQDLQNIRAFAPETADELVKFLANPGINETIAKNLTTLKRASPDNYRYIMDMFDYAFAPRKRLVSGMLGGLALPNPIYHAENFLTAPLIASITDPKYIDAVVGQQLRIADRVADAARGKGVHFDPTVARDVEMGYEGLRRFVTKTDALDDGTPVYRIGNYTLDEATELYRTKNLGSTESSLQFGDNFVRDVEDMAKGYGGAIAGYAKRGTIAPGSGTPYGMKIADSTDRMFREAVFFDALSKGSTGDEAATLAKTVLLDYGSMPLAAQETIGKYFLFMSFTYTMGAETLGAMARTKAFKMSDFTSKAGAARAVLKPGPSRSLIAQANYHRKLSEQMFGKQTELQDTMFFNEIDKVYEKDAKAYNVYLRSPFIQSMSQIAGTVEAIRKPKYILSKEELEIAAAKDQKMSASGISLEALSVGYNPLLSLLGSLSMEYKKPVPDKFVYQLSALPTEGFMASPYFINEVFDIEYVPSSERRPGRAEVGVDRKQIDMSTGLPIDDMTIEELEAAGRGGYQMRFKSERGYQNYQYFQSAVAYAGYQRLINNLTGALIAAGQLPEGTSFGYSEKGNPVLYYAGRQKQVRVPQEWEKLDRQMRMYERELKEYMGQFEEK